MSLPVTKVSLDITTAVILTDAAVKLLTIYRANAALKGQAEQAVANSLDLEAAIKDSFIAVKEVTGQV